MKRTVEWKMLARGVWVLPLVIVVTIAGCATEEGSYSVASVDAATAALAQDLDLDDDQMERLNGYGEMACERHQSMTGERQGRFSGLRDAMADCTLDAEALHELIDANFDEIRDRAHAEADELMELGESMDQGQREAMAGRLAGFDEDIRAACGEQRSGCGGSCDGSCGGREGSCSGSRSERRGSCSGDCGSH